MKIEILGTGCAKCSALAEAAKQAVAKVGGFHSVEKVEDIVEIMNYNVVSTPALVIDGEVKSTGKLLNVNDIVEFMNGASANAGAESSACDCGGKC